LIEIDKTDIRSLSIEDLKNFFSDKGFPSYRAEQVFQWLWQKGAYNFESMTNLPIELRSLLKSFFEINNIEIDSQQKSLDGTIKNGIRLHDNLVVESVLIPTSKRSTGCVSSQVGCSLDCTFCATASLKRMRNLNLDEIYDQVLVMSKQSILYFKRPLSNIVFMGMGEPLMNYKNVIGAIEKITKKEGLGFSPRRITISTSGIPKLIRKLADDGIKSGLAVSLHSARQEVREEIMPFSKKFPLETLRQSLLYWQAKTKKIITFEYIVWEGINDSLEDVNSLISFCKDLKSKVNIIEYNSIGKDKYKQAISKSIKSYMQALDNSKIKATFRKSRGRDIDAACGQLANKLIS
jgi:23S rRNA (adenine2503-C2)-methyltransferase